MHPIWVRYGHKSRAGNIPQHIARCYATAQKKHIDWNIVFDPNSSKTRALSQFKKNLLYLTEKGLKLSTSSQEFQIVRHLSNQGKLSTQQLCEMIMQHRINEHDVWEAILQARHKYPANITVPRSIEGSKSVRSKRQHLLKLKPQKVDRLEVLIDTVENSQAKEPVSRENSTVFERANTKIEESSEVKQRTKDIDVEFLGNYLQKAGQHGNRRKKYTWEDPKHFSWDQTTNQHFKLSPGEILFQNSMYKRYGTKRFDSFKHDASKLLSFSGKGPNLDQDIPTELLIYSLTSKKHRIISLTNDSSLFNINYKDLFGIINSSKNAPEETLSVINRFETEGWKLIGDLYDNSQTIAFQRNVVLSSHNGGKAFIKKPWFWATVFSVFLYGLYRNQSSQSSSSKQPLDKADNHASKEDPHQ